MTAKKKYLTRDDILNADDLVREEVFIPEWNNMTAWVRSLTARERDSFEASMPVDQKAGKLNLKTFAPGWSWSRSSTRIARTPRKFSRRLTLKRWAP